MLEFPHLARHSFGVEQSEADVQVVVVGFVAYDRYRQGEAGRWDLSKLASRHAAQTTFNDTQPRKDSTNVTNPSKHCSEPDKCLSEIIFESTGENRK